MGSTPTSPTTIEAADGTSGGRLTGERQRDARFASQERHKPEHREKKGAFGIERFRYNPDKDTYTCPQGKELTCQSANHSPGDGHRYRRYRSKARDCARCPLRGACIARGGRRKSLAIPIGGAAGTRTARMRAKIDTPEARTIYGRRLAIVEPVFANLRSNKRLDRFTYRGRAKVSVQWQLYCLVHNLEKLAHLSRTYGPKRVKSALKCLSSALIRPITYLATLSRSLCAFFRPLPIFSLTSFQT
jgi:hypothetical protein